MNSRNLGDRILAARIGMKMTQAELAERLGCSRGHISNLERGEFEPSFPLYRKLVKVLKLLDR